MENPGSQARASGLEGERASEQVILFQTQRFDPEIVAQYDRIARAAGGRFEPVVLYHHSEGPLPEALHRRPHHVVTDSMLRELGYPMYRSSIIPGSVHFPLLRFYRENPSYRYYWFIEFDVRFTGSWRAFLEKFGRAEDDFIACRVRGYAEQPDWPWWDLTHPTRTVPLEERLASFNPIFRISGSALGFLDGMHRDGWRGHNEVFFATLLRQGGFGIRDFGGRGRFVAAGDEGRYYVDVIRDSSGRLLHLGSMRANPPFRRAGWRRNKLYHPVKADAKAAESTRAEWMRGIRRALYRMRITRR
jgi:hypothetical protein